MNLFNPSAPRVHTRTGWFRATVSALALFAWLLSSPAQAAPFTAADAKTVRSVVEAQLAALAKDDAPKAFSYAAPNIRQSIGTANAFLEMVKNSYPVVYRPASVTFLKAEGTGDEVLQRVQMSNAAGDSFIAIYSLQRQKDKSWRIAGCLVAENKARMA